MPQYTNRDIIICGMPAQSMTLKQQIDCIIVAILVAILILATIMLGCKILQETIARDR